MKECKDGQGSVFYFPPKWYWHYCRGGFIPINTPKALEVRDMKQPTVEVVFLKGGKTFLELLKEIVRVRIDGKKLCVPERIFPDKSRA